MACGTETAPPTAAHPHGMSDANYQLDGSKEAPLLPLVVEPLVVEPGRSRAREIEALKQSRMGRFPGERAPR